MFPSSVSKAFILQMSFLMVQIVFLNFLNWSQKIDDFIICK